MRESKLMAFDKDRYLSWTDEQKRAFNTGDYLFGWRNAAIRFVVSLVIIADVVLTVWQKIYDWFIE